MNLRLAPWRCVPLGLLLAAGCLYPVREKIDCTVCDLAAEPRDVRPAPADQTPPTMPPAPDPGVKREEMPAAKRDESTKPEDRRNESEPDEVQQTSCRPDAGAVLIAQSGGAAKPPPTGGTGSPQKPGT